MTAFNEMKKKRTGGLGKLKAKMEKENTSGGSADERFWKLSTDKASNGYAEIRFLQPTEGEDFPYIKKFHHAFKVGAKWFWKNCPTSIGLDCPVCEANSELWATEDKSNQDIVRKRKRQTKYIANILVINDTAVPENNGKVFLFEFGKKIFDKIMDSTKEDELDPDVIAINPFCFWEGANFKLKSRQVEGYANYDKSEFSKQSAIAETDEAIEDIWGKQHKLNTFIAEDEFESYDKLLANFNKALGNKSKAPESIEGGDDEQIPTKGFKQPKSATPKLEDTTVLENKESASGDDDSEMDFYNGLLED